ncbi:MAG TPA: hypothetical protein VH092_37985 [Urbifossiella sp.]|nr:hypothetical protein [Urbifossiella sp.]
MSGRRGRVRAATMLPIVRAAMARGEGPPAVIAWVRRQGVSTARWPNWTAADEARAQILAARLAESLDGWGRAAAETGRSRATVGPPCDSPQPSL